jgi:hypothetical protein
LARRPSRTVRSWDRSKSFAIRSAGCCARGGRPAPALEGWALSTVAAHELYHYLNNEHDHHNGRLNQEVMTPEGLVQGWSYDVMTASSGEEALALHGITPRGSTF